jgi:hypothetical protein
MRVSLPQAYRKCQLTGTGILLKMCNTNTLSIIEKDPMLSLKSAELAIAMLTFFLAYLVVVTIAGSVSAWVAQKMGDSSAADAGFLTLNPFQHIDLLGLMFFFMLGIGWDKHMPIDPTSIYARSNVVRWIKICVAYWARSFAHFTVGTIAMALLFLQFGSGAIRLVLESMTMRLISPEKFGLLYPEHSSLMISIGLVLVSIVHISLLFAVFDFLLNAFAVVMAFLIEKSPEYAQYYNMVTIFLYLTVIVMFIIPQFWWFVLTLMSWWGYALASIFTTT